MRITIDTEKNAIIVPNTFYAQIDKKNQVLREAGVDNRIDYTQFVKDAFNKAIENPMLRQSDTRK